MADAKTDLLRSSLDLLLLKALADRRQHGSGLRQWIDRATRGLVQVEEGTLYPALQRLERRGWVVSEWGFSVTNRRARFYALTAAGRARRGAESRIWHAHAGAIMTALRRG